MKYLTKPLTKQEMTEKMDENGYICENVLVDISDMIDNDIEGFIDTISEKLTGSPCLMDVSYKVVGIVGKEDDKHAGLLVMEVSGDVSEILDF